MHNKIVCTKNKKKIENFLKFLKNLKKFFQKFTAPKIFVKKRKKSFYSIFF